MTDAYWSPLTGTSVGAVCTISATTLVTLAPASITNDSGYLIVVGASA